MEERFYKIEHGWATRYLWLDSIGEAKEGPPYTEDLIKENKVTFGRYSGTTPGDILGGTSVLNYYSETLVNLLRENGAKLHCWPIKIIRDKKIKHELPQYYYAESVFYLKGIYFGTWMDENDRKSIEKSVIRWFNEDKTIYLVGERESNRVFVDFSNWVGEELFGVENSKVIIITEKLKKIIERAKLKNIMFKEIKPVKSLAGVFARYV